YGFFSLYLKEELEAHSVLVSSGDRVRTNLADFFGVSQVNILHLRPIAETGGQTNSFASFFEWEPRSTFMPMVTAGQKPIFVHRTNSLSAMLTPEFDPRRIVFLTLEARHSLSVTNETDARILSRNISWQSMNFEVESSEPSMVVLAQTFYLSRRALVDKKPTALVRANHALQALEVPA